MPRTNLLRNTKDTEIDGVIGKYLGIRGMKKSDLARITCIPKATLCKALNDKSFLRIYQLRLIYDALQVPAEERRGL